MNELRRYFTNFDQETAPPVVLLLLLAGSSLVPGLTVGLVQIFIDGYPGSLNLKQVGWIAAGIAALHMADSVLQLAASRKSTQLAERVSARVRSQLYQRYIALGDAPGSAGERLANLIQDVDDLRIGLDALVAAYRDTLIVAVLASMSYALAPQVAPLGVAVLPIAVIPTAWFGARVRKRGTEARAARSHFSRLAQDQLAGASTIRALQADSREHARFVVADRRDWAARSRLALEGALPAMLVRAIMTAGLGVLLWIGADDVAQGSLTSSRLLGFLVALTWTVRPLTGISVAWTQMQSGMAALERVHATLETLSPVQPPAEPVALPSGALSVEWRRVTVDFGAGVVLHRVTLDISAGSVVALVGLEGSGRSTLLRLVGRQLDPDVGEVLLGGVDVRLLSVADLRRAVVLVSGSEHVFARTLAENLRLSSEGATDAELLDVLHKVGARQWAEQLTGGIHTPLDELSLPVSAARCQQIALARALLSPARVLIFDCATCQLSAQEEHTLIEQLRLLAGERTVLIVPRDLDILPSVDRVVILQGGRVIETGRHENLLAGGTVYPRLWRERRGAAVE